jgi:hypothetical protein
MPRADWAILGALAVVIVLAVIYNRRHSGHPPR